jgi:hypothetical protein
LKAGKGFVGFFESNNWVPVWMEIRESQRNNHSILRPLAGRGHLLERVGVQVHAPLVVRDGKHSCTEKLSSKNRSEK